MWFKLKHELTYDSTKYCHEDYEANKGENNFIPRCPVGAVTTGLKVLKNIFTFVHFAIWIWWEVSPRSDTSPTALWG